MTDNYIWLKCLDGVPEVKDGSSVTATTDPVVVESERRWRKWNKLTRDVNYLPYVPANWPPISELCKFEEDRKRVIVLDEKIGSNMLLVRRNGDWWCGDNPVTTAHVQATYPTAVFFPLPKIARTRSGG